MAGVIQSMRATANTIRASLYPKRVLFAPNGESESSGGALPTHAERQGCHAASTLSTPTYGGPSSPVGTTSSARSSRPSPARIGSPGC